MKTKILITGGAGNIGSALVQTLVRNKNYFVVAVDNLSTGSLKNLAPVGSCENFKFIRSDVNDYHDLCPIMIMYEFDYVFHYAAVVGVQRTLKNPVNVLRDLEGFKNVFNLSKNIGVKRVFFSSSSEVYGEPFGFPQHEHFTPLNSRLPYAVIKNVGETFLRAYQQEFNIDYTIFRFFNTYSPYQTVDFVIPKFVKAALQNKDITIYGNGKQTRTFCYIDDNIEATVRIMENNLFVNDTINIGNDVEYSILDLAQLIISLTNSSSKIVHLPSLKEGDMTRRKPDITKMKSVLNRDFVPLEEGIRHIIRLQLQSDSTILTSLAKAV